MAKFKTKGLEAAFDTSTPPTTVIAQLGDGTLDLGEREAALDVTSHDNTTGTVEQMDNGFKLPMSYSGEIFFDPENTTHTALRTAHEAGTADTRLQIKLPTTKAARWHGLVRVKSFTIPAPVKGALKASIMLEGMGAATYAQNES